MIKVSLQLAPHMLVEVVPGLTVYSNGDTPIAVTVGMDKLPAGEMIPGVMPGAASIESTSVPVFMSRELLTELAEWSAPVQVRAHTALDGTVSLETRSVPNDGQ